jgi:hypothetical protein
MKLNIKSHEHLKIKIEEPLNFNKSIFKDVYSKASDALENHLNISNELSNLYEEPNNNVIAFNGERGTGKSSTMLSFARSLTNKSHGFYKDNGYDKIERTKFYVLDVVDPSLFKGDDKLFESIISKIYLTFQTNINENKELKLEEKRNLISLFQVVFENLRTIHGGKSEVYHKEAIEALSDLANGSNLKKNFENLIKTFLQNVGKDASYLVVPIDDFDLNISKTYEMLEDIRQFLILPQIIILVACKKDQLLDSVALELNKEYEKLLSHHEYPLSQLNIIEKAEKYTDKLFPFSRTIQLPDIQILNFKSLITESIFEDEKLDYEKIILELIYTELNIFISKPDFGNNQFYPGTLREFIHFISIFELINNKTEKFKEFITNQTKMHLEGTNIFQLLESTSDQSIIVKILNQFETIFENTFWDFREKYSALLNARNPLNTSIGDLFFILSAFESQLLSSNSVDKKYENLISVYLSIRLHNLTTNNNFKLLGNLYTQEMSCFPKKENKHRRDWISFDFTKIEAFKENKTDLFWLGFFINHIGVLSANFRSETDYPYFKEIQTTGGVYTSGVFCIFSPLTFVHFIDEVWKSMNGKTDPINNQLYQDIIEWNQLNVNFIKLLYNPFFFNEMISIFDQVSKSYKGQIGDNENALYTFFIDSSFEVFTKINLKYPYLNIDNFVLQQHPVYQYWIANRNRLVPKLNFLLEQESNSINLIKVSDDRRYRSLISQYVVRISGAAEKQRTLKNLINKLNKFDFENNKKILIELENFHMRMKNSKSKDELNVVNKELIDRMINFFN